MEVIPYGSRLGKNTNSTRKHGVALSQFATFLCAHCARGIAANVGVVEGGVAGTKYPGCVIFPNDAVNPSEVRSRGFSHVTLGATRTSPMPPVRGIVAPPPRPLFAASGLNLYDDGLLTDEGKRCDPM